MTLSSLASLLEDAVRRSDQPVEPLLSSAHHWHEFADLLPRFEDLLDRTESAVKDAATASPEHAHLGLTAALANLETHLAACYVPYRSGRTRLYDACRFWDMAPEPRKKGKSGSSLAAYSGAELVSEAKALLKSLRSSVASASKQAEDSIPELRDGAKHPPLTDADRKRVLDAGLDLRDEASTLFTRGYALLRRAYEYRGRLVGSSPRDTWRPSWVSDPEVGDVES